MVLNLTPDGRFQIARVLKPGGPTEGEFEILFEGSEQDCMGFWREQVRKELPGLRLTTLDMPFLVDHEA